MSDRRQLELDRVARAANERIAREVRAQRATPTVPAETRRARNARLFLDFVASELIATLVDAIADTRVTAAYAALLSRLSEIRSAEAAPPGSTADSEG